MLLPQSYQYPNLSEGADSVGGQLHGDKECPFSGVTSSGRVCRKVPKSDARSVCHCLCGLPAAVSTGGCAVHLSGSSSCGHEAGTGQEAFGRPLPSANIDSLKWKGALGKD